MLNPFYIVTDTGYTTPCWLWLGSLDGKGYGQAWSKQKKKIVRAHRLFFEEQFGVTSLQLDHLCRQRRCVNPLHLQPVINAVNTQRGSRTKLSPQSVMQIVKRRADGSPIQQIADSLGVHNSTISRIVNGKRWSNITSP